MIIKGVTNKMDIGIIIAIVVAVVVILAILASGYVKAPPDIA